MARTKTVKAWLAKSSRDMRTAKALLDIKPPFLSEAAFFCQQSIEKSFKALLLAKNKRIIKTHNLTLLFNEVVALNFTIEISDAKLESITQWAVAYRYPDAGAERLTKRKIEIALRFAKSIYDKVLQTI